MRSKKPEAQSTSTVEQDIRFALIKGIQAEIDRLKDKYKIGIKGKPLRADELFVDQDDSRETALIKGCLREVNTFYQNILHTDEKNPLKLDELSQDLKMIREKIRTVEKKSGSWNVISFFGAREKKPLDELIEWVNGLQRQDAKFQKRS